MSPFYLILQIFYHNNYRGNVLKECFIILISIIIPVYNKERYLNDCIESIVNQEYKNLEIIIIDDGSIDGSNIIIHKWAKIDKRIKHIVQKNQGVSSTRNKGISLSNGEYVFFMDADDMLSKDAILKLVSSFRDKNVDIVIANHQIKKSNSNILENNQNIMTGIIGKDKIRSSLVKNNLFLSMGRPMATVWNKLYRLDFITKANIKFEENVIAEDRLFNLKLYLNDPEILLIDQFTYIFRKIEDSRSRSYNKNFYNESIELFNSLNSYLISVNKFDSNKDLVYYTLLYDINKILAYYYKNSNRSIGEISKVIGLLKQNTNIKSTLSSISSDKTVMEIKGTEKFYYRSISYLFLFASDFLLSLFFVAYTLSKGQLRKLKDIIRYSKKHKINIQKV